MAERHTKAYMRRLECPVCLDIYNNPLGLPCRKGVHTLCRECVRQLVRGSSITCPICRAIHAVPSDGVDGFPSNLMAVDMIDALCPSCRKADHQTRCSHCDRNVCLACQVSHMLFGEAERSRDELRRIIQRGKHVGNIRSTQRAQKIHKEIDSAVAKLIRKLEQRGIALKAEVDRILDENGASLEKWKLELDEKIAEAQSYLDATDTTLDQEYQENTTNDEMIAIKAQCEQIISDMQDSVDTSPSLPQPIFKYDSTQALSAIAEFGEIRRSIDNTQTPQPTTSQPTSSQLVRYRTARLNTSTSTPLTYRRPIVVGTGGSGPSQFSRPRDVAVCPVTSHVVVADAGNKRVQILTSDFRHVTDIRRGRQGQELKWPVGVAVNSCGDIIVTDYSANAVFVYTEDGVYSRQLPGPWSKPRGVVIDSDNVTYICDAGTHSIKVVDQSGKLVSTIGSEGSGPGQFGSQPWFITIYNDNLHVSDGAGRVYVFTKSGTFLKHGDSAIIAEARGLAVLGSEYLVIVDYKDSIAVMRDDQLICRIGESGSQSGQLYAPRGVTVSKTGQIIVANFGNHNILVFDPSN